MRVIAGTARSLPLKTVPGNETRPTTDRIKETLFNILMPYIPDCRFLDLFAGSGAIGIEALSRGARYSVFVEKNRRAAACIRDNLVFTRLMDRAKIMECDVLAAIGRLAGGTPFDVVFLDPPYAAGAEGQVLKALRESGVVDGDSLIVVEAALRTSLDFVREAGFTVEKLKQYKTNVHIFLRIV